MSTDAPIPANSSEDTVSALERLGWDARLAASFVELGNPGLVPGRVGIVYGKICHLYLAHGEVEGTITGRLRHEAGGPQDLPVVGDWVACRSTPDVEGVSIQAILPRRTSLSRKVAGSVTERQVLAANVDVVFLMVGLDHDYNPRRLERSLIMVREGGAAPVVLLNKADRCEVIDARRAKIEAVAAGAPVHVISARTGQGVSELDVYLRAHRTVVLIGSSGVGKSTLINRLLGADLQRTREVRARDSRGRHTTTHRELIGLPGGALMIDTPGLRELQLWEGTATLDRTFDDISDMAPRCRFADCRHEREPGCAVRAAVEAGDLSAGRLESYLKLQRELEHQATRQDNRPEQVQRKKWKAIHKAMRNVRLRG